jgi:hypothetical protein
MRKTIIKASVFAALLLIQLCSGSSLKAAPGQMAGGTMTLRGDTDYDLFIGAPLEISGWKLSPSASPGIKPISLTVYARMCWQVFVESDRPDGRMAQCDLSNSKYIADGKRLESPLKISAKGADEHSDPWEVALPEGGVIQEGEETAGKCLNADVYISQAVSWTDEPLPEDQAYRAVLRFTISPAE